MKTTEELIKELTSTQTSISRDYSPLARTVIFLYLLFSIMALALYWIRPFSFSLQNLNHAIEVTALFLFLNSLTYFGFKSFIPGENKKTSFYFVITSLMFVVLAFTARLFAPQTYNVIRPNCEFEAMAISLVTTFIGHLVLRKNEYALNSGLSKCIFLSVPMMAILFLHGVCSLEFQHVLMCHILAAQLIPVAYLITISRMKAFKGSSSNF